MAEGSRQWWCSSGCYRRLRQATHWRGIGRGAPIRASQPPAALSERKRWVLRNLPWRRLQ